MSERLDQVLTEKVAEHEHTDLDVEDAEQAIDVLENDQEALEKEIKDLQQRLLRVSADFDNFRKRTKTEKEQLANFAQTQLIVSLLPVLDNFQRALEVHEPEPEIRGFLKGFEMIFKQLLDVLQQSGLEAIDCVGQPFDPQLHDGVMQAPDASVAENSILEDLRTGYIFKDRVIRPSMVKVAKNE